MKRILAIFVSILIGTSARGLPVDVNNYISVTPSNAASHGIALSYHAPIPRLITVIMPYQQGKATFDHAELEVSAGEQHFKIPVNGKKNGKKSEQKKLFIGFLMDRKTLRQATLRIRFEEEGELEGTVFVIRCQDFVSKKEGPHNK